VNIRRTIRSAFRRAFFDRNSYRYHFIHIPKNGGESVRFALELHKDISLSTPFHFRYVDIVDELGPELKYFCIVRNPWSRTASRYMFGKQNANRWSDDDPRRKYILSTSFESFVKDQHIIPIPEHPGMPWMGPLSSWFNQLEWMKDKDGRVMCDCLRLECLDEDLSAYLNRETRISRQNVTNTRYDYRSMYDEELKQIVAETFEEDIDYFGFDFESGATKNIVSLDPRFGKHS
jgi:hypothetical protein